MAQRRPWHEVATRLVDVAAGRAAAELVVRNGRWVNVLTREVVDGHRYRRLLRAHRLYRGRGGLLHRRRHPGRSMPTGRFLVPGLTDGHLHVESSMCTITEYVRAVLPHGTTAIFADPHEIANVFGLDGVRMMVAEAAAMPIHVFVQMPSCVPSAPGLETPGARITPREVEEAMSWPGVIGLGEMMNFPGLANNDPKMHAEVAATMRAGKTVGGHYASPELDRAFHGYLAGGPADDHENTREVDAVERARRGLRPMLRFGSAWYDVAAQITAVTERGLDPRQFILCTDDAARRHAGAGGTHGPGAASRGRAGLRPAGGVADDDHQYRATLRGGARPGVPGAGALRRPGAGREPGRLCRRHGDRQRRSSRGSRPPAARPARLDA